LAKEKVFLNVAEKYRYSQRIVMRSTISLEGE